MKTAGDVSIRRLSVGEISPVSKRGVAAKSLYKGKQQPSPWDPLDTSWHSRSITA